MTYWPIDWIRASARRAAHDAVEKMIARRNAE